MVSPGLPHVLRAHIGHTCGEPYEIEVAPIRGEIERLAKRTTLPSAAEPFAHR